MFYSSKFNGLILFLSQVKADSSTFETDFVLIRKNGSIDRLMQSLFPEQKEDIMKFEWLKDSGSLMICVPKDDKVLIYGGQMNVKKVRDMQFRYINDFSVNPYLFTLDFKILKEKKKEDSKKDSKKDSKQKTTLKKNDLKNNTKVKNLDVKNSYESRYMVEWNIQPYGNDVRPPLRFHHSGCIWNENKLLIFGGQTEEMVNLNDLWCLDLETWEWNHMPCTGDVPTSRRLHSMEIVNDRFIYIFGGLPLNNDLYRLDLESCLWIKINFNLAPTIGLSKDSGSGWDPSNHSKFDLETDPRFGHSMNFIGNSLIIFGGQDMKNYFTDTIQIPVQNVDEYLRAFSAFKLEDHSKRYSVTILDMINPKDKVIENTYSNENTIEENVNPLDSFDDILDNKNDLDFFINDDMNDDMFDIPETKIEPSTQTQDDIDPLDQIYDNKIAEEFKKLREELKEKDRIIEEQKRKLEEQEKQLKEKDEIIQNQKNEIQKLKEQVRDLQYTNKGLDKFISLNMGDVPNDLRPYLPSRGPFSDHIHKLLSDQGYGLYSVTLGNENIEKIVKDAIDQQENNNLDKKYLNEQTDTVLSHMKDNELRNAVQTKDFLIKHLKEKIIQQNMEKQVNEVLLKEIKNDNVVLRQKIQELEEDRENLQTKIREEFKEKLEKLEDLQKDNDTYQNMIKKLQEENQNLKLLEDENENLKSEIQKLQNVNQQLELVEKENDSLRSEVKKLQEVNQKLTSVEKENETLKSEIQVLREQNSLLQNSQALIAQLEMQVHQLQHQLQQQWTKCPKCGHILDNQNKN